MNTFPGWRFESKNARVRTAIILSRWNQCQTLLWLLTPSDDGIDTRIHGIKIKSSKEMDLGLNSDLFKPENLVRFPKLEGFPQLALYRRALLLQR